MKLKVGDRVKVKSSAWNPSLKGKEGEVMEILESSRQRKLACVHVSFDPKKKDRFLFTEKEIKVVTGDVSQVKD